MGICSCSVVAFHEQFQSLRVFDSGKSSNAMVRGSEVFETALLLRNAGRSRTAVQVAV